MVFAFCRAPLRQLCLSGFDAGLLLGAHLSAACLLAGELLFVRLLASHLGGLRVARNRAALLRIRERRARCGLCGRASRCRHVGGVR